MLILRILFFLLVLLNLLSCKPLIYSEFELSKENLMFSMYFWMIDHNTCSMNKTEQNTKLNKH